MDSQRFKEREKPLFLAIKTKEISGSGKGYTLFFGVDSNNQHDVLGPISEAEKLAVRGGGHLGIIGSQDQKTKIPLLHNNHDRFAITTSAPTYNELKARYPNAEIKLLTKFQELKKEYFALIHPEKEYLTPSKATDLENMRIDTLREEIIRRNGAWEHTLPLDLFRLTIHNIPDKIDLTDKFLKLVAQEVKQQGYTCTHTDERTTLRSAASPGKHDLHLFVSKDLYENVIQNMKPRQRTNPSTLLSTFSELFSQGILSRPR